MSLNNKKESLISILTEPSQEFTEDLNNLFDEGEDTYHEYIGLIASAVGYERIRDFINRTSGVNTYLRLGESFPYEYRLQGANTKEQFRSALERLLGRLIIRSRGQESLGDIINRIPNSQNDLNQQLRPANGYLNRAHELTSQLIQLGLSLTPPIQRGGRRKSRKCKRYVK